MKPSIHVPSKFNIKAPYEEFYSLQTAIEIYEAANPIEFPMFIIDLLVFERLYNFNVQLKKKVSAAGEKGSKNVSVTIPFSTLVLLNDQIQVKRTDSLYLNRIKEKIKKITLMYKHLILFDEEQDVKISEEYSTIKSISNH